ncbi:MAG TPA: isoaspartyl peptidase/L-asparaginase [Longimicrobiaceae bacterium]|nr:isoaspartyl peptidase/L-asparaginase [Longimicrobiaceae bacterium]
MTLLNLRILRGLGVAGVILAFGACAPDSSDADAPAADQTASADSGPGWGIVIHGGAGTINRGDMTPEQEAEYRAKLTEALEAGHGVLSEGGSSLDAVVAAINVMEDSPLFNAGKGAVFTAEGKNEMDAAIMDGSTRMAGAVTGVTHVKNPINLARLVMEESPHVFMAGAGAETFGREQGVEMVPEEYFYTERRWESLQRAKAEENGETAAATGGLWNAQTRKYGTVGAVALDQQGNLAAGTSTGGMTNKKWGRIGDAPVIGAGTYAGENCGVSATGHGEYFIRSVVAYDICAISKYLNVSIEEAANTVVMEKLVEFGGSGGVIAMDGQGNVAMPFNSTGMYRGYMGQDGTAVVEIYRN